MEGRFEMRRTSTFLTAQVAALLGALVGYRSNGGRRQYWHSVGDS